MKVEIGQPQQFNSFGKVSVNREGHTIELQARMAYVQETSVGLDLIYSSDTDRKTMVDLVESLVPVRDSKVRSI